MARVLGHRQPKGAGTDNPDLLSPRHISTLPVPDKAVRDQMRPLIAPPSSTLITDPGSGSGRDLTRISFLGSPRSSRVALGVALGWPQTKRYREFNNLRNFPADSLPLVLPKTTAL